jgi:hypothetical protein
MPHSAEVDEFVKVASAGLPKGNGTDRTQALVSQSPSRAPPLDFHRSRLFHHRAARHTRTTGHGWPGTGLPTGGSDLGSWRAPRALDVKRLTNAAIARSASVREVSLTSHQATLMLKLRADAVFTSEACHESRLSRDLARTAKEFKVCDKVPKFCCLRMSYGL